MNDFFNIKSPNYLGGNNVHNTLALALLGLISWKVGVFKK
jgi:hypothetical protein